MLSMEIKFLGTGGAFEPHKGNVSAIIERNDTKILIDCGYAVLERIIAKDLAKDLDYVLITHLHGDHAGSLPTLLAYMEHVVGKELPIIYATEQHKDQIHEFLTIAWEDKRAHYSPITELPWIGFVDTFGQHVAKKQTFAYYFKDAAELIFYSGDINNTETVLNFLKEREEEKIQVFLDINKNETSGHIYYKEAMEKMTDYEVYGYHCAKETIPEDNTIPLVEDYSELNH